MLLALGAVVVGLSKTALPGAGTLAVALFAAVLPARESTATLLLLLIVGDMFALWTYRRHARWRMLVRLIPAVLAGILLGVLFLAVADDVGVRRVIGVLLLLVVAVTLWRRYAAARGGREPSGGWPAAAVYGTLGGFTTMVANAAGPVMSMYFLAARFPVKTFLGTAAWFFAVVNIGKVPFAAALGLFSVDSLWIDLWLLPAVIVGALAGRVLARRLRQEVFERLVIVLTVIGALYLLW
ncbi:sulfite exporter TauE/SafE family protein [Microbacterium lushaniae]|uniref:Probable membrane transporter protein n=1 Tax=Microbacterium lushaniae TaxID=2614639 RepID=A0A5J6L8L6_9MICO|nr:sulfite exporter TauE/SafE family protein [Microbacterium lushaniae]QEW04914.1 sulfite exporter TauE/SafE family protein [Microbacterium lushaniae]